MVSKSVLTSIFAATTLPTPSYHVQERRRRVF